jgi:hypothetical protein
MMRRSPLSLLAVLGASLALAGCGSSSKPPSTSASASSATAGIPASERSYLVGVQQAVTTFEADALTAGKIATSSKSTAARLRGVASHQAAPARAVSTLDALHPPKGFATADTGLRTVFSALSTDSAHLNAALNAGQAKAVSQAFAAVAADEGRLGSSIAQLLTEAKASATTSGG